MNVEQNIYVAVDAVVFGYNKADGLSVLLIKRKYDPLKGLWAIPGGFVKEEESIQDAVHRELLEETGVKVTYLEQLQVFGKPKRDPRKRVVSIAYIGMVKTEEYTKFKASTDASDAKWYSIKSLPILAFDHEEIIKFAIQKIQFDTKHKPIGYELLNKTFTFSDLERLYTVLLDSSLDRRNFKKKIMSLGIIEETNLIRKKDGPGRPGKLYQFNRNKYNQLTQEGYHF